MLTAMAIFQPLDKMRQALFQLLDGTGVTLTQSLCLQICQIRSDSESSTVLSCGEQICLITRALACPLAKQPPAIHSSACCWSRATRPCMAHAFQGRPLLTQTLASTWDTRAQISKTSWQTVQLDPACTQPRVAASPLLQADFHSCWVSKAHVH